MTNEERLNHRARQILGDDTLPLAERLEDPASLLRQLANDVQGNPQLFAAVLEEITDPHVREQMRVALQKLLR